MGRKQMLALAALWLATCAATPAQRYTYRQYGPNDGLTNLTVICLLQDRAGTIWAGTENGIFAYQGNKFRQYGRQEGLPNNEIGELAEAPDGVLWAATQGGLARLVGGRFQVVETGVPGWLRRIQFDANGTMYLTSSWGLLEGIPAGQDNYRFVKRIPGTISAIHVAGKTLWFGKDQKLWELAGDRAEPMESDKSLPADQWDSITLDSLGNLWVRSITRLYERVQGQSHFVDRSSGIPTSPDSSLYADRQGGVYVTGESGAMLLDGDKRVLFNAEHGVPSNSIYSLLIDHEGTLWLGTFGVGLLRRLGHGNWMSWKKEDGLADDIIWAVREGEEGRVWVATSKGLSLIRADGQVDKKWKIPGDAAGSRVTSIANAPQGEFFASTLPIGIYRFSASGQLLGKYGVEAGLRGSYYIYDLAIDHEGYLWVAGNHGCYRSDQPIQHSPLRFSLVQIPGLQSPPSVREVMADHRGWMWLATSVGLFQFDGTHWRAFGKAEGLAEADLDGVIDGQDDVWVQYRDSLGIARLHLQGDKAVIAQLNPTAQGMSDLAYSLALDKAGKLWMGTDRGVNLYDHGQWRHIDEHDGLIWNDTDHHALFAAKDGSMWVGTSGGLSRFVPPVRSVAAAPPTVVIGGAQALDRDFETYEPLTLPFDHRSIQISFGSMNFDDEGRTRFRYRLQGYDAGWSETTEHSVLYSGLPSGHYAFEVIAAGPEERWSAQPARYSFTIQTPWWLTWPFIGMCIMVVALGGRLLWRLRLRMMIDRQHELERQIAERTAELQESHRQLVEIAYLDVLTDLANRRMFNDLFHRQIAQAARAGDVFALLLIDLNRFKQINDVHGHDVGDAVLIETAVRLRAAVREGDCVARLGGDEFAILMTNIAEIIDLEAVCARLVESFDTPLRFKGNEIPFSCSVGVAIYPGDGNFEETLYKCADRALYRAKASQPHYCFYGARSDDQQEAAMGDRAV